MNNIYLIGLFVCIAMHCVIYYMFRLLNLIKTVHKNVKIVVDLIGLGMIIALLVYINEAIWHPWSNFSCFGKFLDVFRIIGIGHYLTTCAELAKCKISEKTYNTVIGYKIFKCSFGMIDVFTERKSDLFPYYDGKHDVTSPGKIMTMFSSAGVFMIAGVVFEKMVL